MSADEISFPFVHPKAVLKHAQSKRWREIRGVPANAERLDCARFIAAFPRRATTPFARFEVWVQV